MANLKPVGIGAALSTDGTLSSNSDNKVSTEKAVKSYVDTSVSAVPQVSITTYSAKGDAQQYMDGSMTLGSAVLTTTGSHFVAGDVGKTIAVAKAGGTLEDFTTYTEVDTYSYITKTTTRGTVTNMPGGYGATDESLYKDYGASYFSGNFSHYISFKETWNSGTGTFGSTIWSLQAAVGPSTTTNSIWCAVNTTSSAQILYAYEYYNSSLYNSAGLSLTAGTQYWLTITRSSTTFTIKVYSDSSRSTLVGTQSLTLQSAVAYRYLYSFMAAGGDATAYCTVFTEALALTSQPGGTLITTIASYQSTTQVTLSQIAGNTVSTAVYAWGTENTAYIQNAIDAARTSGISDIVVPFGRFLCTGSLTMYNNLALAGAARGPWYPQNTRIGSDPSTNDIPQLWILNEAAPFLQYYTKLSGTMTSGQATVTGLSSTTKLFIGEVVSAYYGSGSVPYAYPGGITTYAPVIQSIDSASQITLNGNANYSGTVTIVAGINSASIEDLFLYYPMQRLAADSAAPIAYPPTIQLLNNNGFKIRRCSFVNPYDAIDIGTGQAGDYTCYGSYSTIGWLEDLFIGNIHNGIQIDHQFDSIHAKGIHFVPMWLLCGPDQPAASSVPTNLYNWIVANATMFQFSRMDSFQGQDIFGLWQKTGMSFIDSSDTWMNSAERASYGKMNNVELDGIDVGISAKSVTPNAAWNFNNIGMRGGRPGTTNGTYAVQEIAGGTNAPTVKINGGIVNSTWTNADMFLKLAGATLEVVNVQGYNPKGGITPPSFPGTGSAYTNPKAYPVRIFITGGTISDISIGSTSTGLTSGLFVLGANESIKITYTGSPTWTWFGI